MCDHLLLILYQYLVINMTKSDGKFISAQALVKRLIKDELPYQLYPVRESIKKWHPAVKTLYLPLGKLLAEPCWYST